MEDFRQIDHERCAPARYAIALHLDRSTMGLDKLPGDGQAQPAVRPIVAGSIPAPEAVKDEGQVFGWDP
jgi:hypothetical protein